ncbi:unnamed protein product [Spirodela intermedia]|uniref:Protein ECERIFERUM 7 n=1 Tax=Spirodela intermedia TaxID=51605 RepID=A0A7I8KR65_SPIIN|nr:unnamed protein product [Spirodela intermedia]
MEQRLANSWRMSVNDKKFIEEALLSDIRIDGRGPFEYRRLTIKFGKEDGQSEVQLGHTHVMAYVTSQLVQPYRDRPNEGTLSIFTELSPMADPSFEVGRPGELAIELGRVIDRGLRESRAVDMESLCVVAGRFVWAVRVDLHIVDNGGNLIDAANIAALAALLTFRRPECTIGGEDGQEITIHPPEVREPLGLIIHHLPVAVTFGIFGEDKSLVVDPTHHEEAVMGGRMTTTVNSNGDVCAIQKAGGEGVMPSEIMRCLRVASVKAAEITQTIKESVDVYNENRSLRHIKRHLKSAPVEVRVPERGTEGNETGGVATDFSKLSSSEAGGEDAKPPKWDPPSMGSSLDSIGSPAALPGSPMVTKGEEAPSGDAVESTEDPEVKPLTLKTPSLKQETQSPPRTLRDAVKAKQKKKKKK